MKSKQITVRHKWTASEKDSVDASQKYLQFVWQIICRKKGVQHFALSMDKKHNFLRELCVCQPCRVNGITLHKCCDFSPVRRHLILSNLLAREKSRSFTVHFNELHTESAMCLCEVTLFSHIIVIVVAAIVHRDCIIRQLTRLFLRLPLLFYLLSIQRTD